MSDFNRVMEQLSAYLDGELSADERAHLEQQLLTDRQLQAELDELRQTVALVQQMPILKAPRNYTLNPAEFQKSRQILPLRAMMAAAAVVVMVCGALFFALSLQGNGESSQEAASSLDKSEEEVALAPTATPVTPVAQATTMAFASTIPATDELFNESAAEGFDDSAQRVQTESAVGTIDPFSAQTGAVAQPTATPTMTLEIAAAAPLATLQPTVDLSQPSGGGAAGQTVAATEVAMPQAAVSEADEESEAMGETASDEAPGAMAADTASNAVPPAPESQVTSNIFNIIQNMLQQILKSLLEILLP